MAANCEGNLYARDWDGPCQNPITHMLDDGRFSCEKHGEPSNKRSVVLYLSINSQVLMMCKLIPNTGLIDYRLPGGNVEEGETDWEAIVRTTYEETGLDIADAIPVFSHENFTGLTAFVARLVSSPFDIKSNGRTREPIWGDPNLLTESYCHYSDYNDALLSKLGVQL